MAYLVEIRDGIRSLYPGKKDLRNLGLTFLAALGLLAGYLAWRSSPAWPWLAGAALLSGSWGLIWPAGLRPLYLVWMSFALVMGATVSRVILTILYFLVVTPTGLLMRLLGKDLLDQKLGDRDSYWHRREPGAYQAKQSEKLY